MNEWTAIMYAANHHYGQVDKSGKPYLYHLMAVAEQLEDPTDRIVAILHDVVEDTHTEVADIEAVFGREVAAAVDALTHAEGETWESYIGRVLKNERAIRVKIADVSHNRSPERLEHLARGVVERMERKHATYQRWLNAGAVGERLP